jgi:hypothetical protein
MSDDALNLRRQASATSLRERLARDHMDKLQSNPGHEAIVKLFCEHPAGFNFPPSRPGQRNHTQQRRMRSAMAKAYCNEDNLAKTEALWDPVLHSWLDKDEACAAHSYPWSVEIRAVRRYQFRKGVQIRDLHDGGLSKLRSGTQWQTMKTWYGSICCQLYSVILNNAYSCTIGRSPNKITLVLGQKRR